MKTLILLLASAASGMAYVHFGNGTTFLQRPDNTNIQFYLNTVAVAGLTNVSGATWISAGSDIPGATAAAFNTWNQVTTANVHFAPAQPTTALDGMTGQNTIIFDDTTEIRTMLGSALAVTIQFGNDTLERTDILFSPTKVFSTTLAATTFDYQSILTHELGHCLGADHTGVLSGTMFQASAPAVITQRVLSQDDMAFLTETYPSNPDLGLLGYGTLTGSVTNAAGGQVTGALISAEDPVTGIIIGSLSNFVDGGYSFIVPAGNYRLWAEPLTGFVKPANLYLPASQVFDSTFQVGTPGPAVAVAAGATVQAQITTVTGVSPIVISYAASVPPGATSVELYAGSSAFGSGQELVFAFKAVGLGVAFSDANVSFIGPVTLVPGSVIPLEDSQYQVTVNVPSVSTGTTATMLLSYNGNTAAYSGGMIVQPVTPVFTAAGVGNAFNYASGAVAPGEIVSIFGTNMGPVTPAAGSLNAGGDLANILSGIQVTFNGVPAPIFFASTGQVNVEVPYEVAGQTSASMVVTNGNSAGLAVSIPVQSGVPGLFVAALNPDGSLNSAANPGPASQYVSLYATGLGALTSAGQPVATGLLVSGAAPATGVTVLVDGFASVPSYAGAAPGFTGLDQVNLVGLTAGQHAVAVVNGAASQTISVWIQ